MKQLIAILVLLAGMGKESLAQQEGKPIVMGTQQELFSRELNEKRLLNIYLPAGYSASDTSRYDVIYLLDGGMDEDFLPLCGIVHFNTYPWVNRLRESIVVGIVNVDRKRDMTFPTTVKADKEKYPTTGGSARFMSFLEKDLLPYMQKSYRITSKNTLIGESLGGLLASQVLLKKPTLFNNYIIISPSLWWNNGSLLSEQVALSATVPPTAINVFIGVGKEGVTPTDPPRVMEVDANILADKLKALGNKNIRLHFDYFPDESHATISHQAILTGFKRLSEAAGK